jgi:SpoVK/Ycf46/Vps4 family AAA+-type ATPase
VSVKNGIETSAEAQIGKASASAVESLNPDDSDVEIEDVVSLQTQGSFSSQGKHGEELAEDSNQQADVENLTVSQRRQARYGSGRVRPNRPRTPEGLPPVIIPEWFFNKNVICAGDNGSNGVLAVCSGQSESEKTLENPIQADDLALGDSALTGNTKYTINADVYREIVSVARSGLTLRPPLNIPMTSINRPLLHLHCPKDDGTMYLDSVVAAIANELNADLIRLDPDDLAQLVGTYVDENLAWTWSKIAILGFEAQKVAGKLEDFEKDQRDAEESTDTEAEDENPISHMFPFLVRPNGQRKKSSFLVSEPNSSLASLLNAARSRAANSPSSENIPRFEFFTTQNDQNTPAQMKSAGEQWLDLKVSAVLDALIGASLTKRTMSTAEAKQVNGGNADSTRSIVVQVADFKLLNAVPDGRVLLRKLREAINKRWFEGRPMLMVGTTSNEELEPALSKTEIQVLQSDVIEGETRTIFVPPNRRQEQELVFESDEKNRIRRINIRHTEDMIMKLAGGKMPSLIVDIEKGLDSAAAITSDLEGQVWAYPRVHRLANTILGLDTSVTNIDGSIFTRACNLLEASDGAKFAWGAAELNEDEEEVEDVLQDLKDPSQMVKEKIKRIRSEGTAHEKRLLGGVISPGDIRTTFSDVRAPKETVEALKTLTSLSLIRPEAFSYGVLATDKIPGLLLYGPPGTGKTLLAKAVAKESGATVLEVSGAEVTDMYVGEGEKNVKAIFSLAKKLSPCVVFIDEADSLLGSRSGESSKRTTHREIINQFLREWDGLKDLSAFIMVATNRPFDLDDAVLRRLPRRLLVDLPTEQDREAILKIHLKDEILDPSVSLLDLAKETPFYSGSDLKNVAVSAAMACIREENEIASKHTGVEPYLYPHKRTLMRHHFTKALDEISASISDDMSTLSAIRKFDEKYGDRRGRRKKASSLGFGGTTVPERDSEAARVRKIEA